MSRPKIIELTKPVYKISASDFSNLVNKIWPTLGYDLELSEETKPGDYLFHTLRPSDLTREYWKAESEYLEANPRGYYGVYALMLAMYKRGVLKPGHYIIEY